jgi:hypothetical protein
VSAHAAGWIRRRAIAVLICGLAVTAFPALGRERRPDRTRTGNDPWYATFYAGYVEAKDSAGQLDAGGGGLALGVGAGRTVNRWFSGELDLLLAFRGYRTPSEIAFADDELDIVSLHVLATAKLWLATGRVRPFVGAGAGPAFARLDVPSSWVPLASRAREEDVGRAYQFVGGVCIALDPGDSNGVFVEYRDLHVDVDFDLVPGGETDIGGWSLAVGYRQRF